MPRLPALALLSAMVLHSAVLLAQYRMLGKPGAAVMPMPPVPQRAGNPHASGSVVLGSPQKIFHHHHVPAQTFFLGEPWLPDYENAGQEQAPEVIVMQPPATQPLAAASGGQESRTVAPLLIELQGDRYVRYGGEQSSVALNTRVLDASQFRTANTDQRAPQASKAESLPVILIFRDAHREEAVNYAIYGGSIYVTSTYWSGDGTPRRAYWNSGAWTRQIRLAEIDLPETIKLNQERGVKFTLPTAPNEVVTRP